MTPWIRPVTWGPMIDRQEVQRIDAWVREAVAQGAVVATGGRAEGRMYHADGAHPGHRIHESDVPGNLCAGRIDRGL